MLTEKERKKRELMPTIEQIEASKEKMMCKIGRYKPKVLNITRTQHEKLKKGKFILADGTKYTIDNAMKIHTFKTGQYENSRKSKRKKRTVR